MAGRRPDLIEFEEEGTDRPVPVGGIVGALIGALLGYKIALQEGIGGTPVGPLPNVIKDPTDQQEGPDMIAVGLTVGVGAAIGYAIGGFFSRVRPRRFMLRHRD